MTAEGETQGAQAAILTLLGERAPGSTICPSEAARRIAGERWRDAMPVAHAAARLLAVQGAVRLTQSGRAVAEPVGAYRIAHASES